MISVEARGRLGNQLFQFAFGLAASVHLQTEFAINDEMLRPNFVLGPWGAPLRRLARGIRYRVSSRLSPFPVIKVDQTSFDCPLDVLGTLKDHTHYAGFFQSELFFRDSAEEVRGAFQPLPEHTRMFCARYQSLLRTPYVCCHVRQTDYRDWRGGVALPASYYRTCLERLACDHQTPIIAVGDDPEWLRSELGDDRIRVERNHEVIDLLLLANAQEVILSNSSFAWWGAWLNERASRILAPQYWVGFKEAREVPPRILPDRWERVPAQTSDRTAG